MIIIIMRCSALPCYPGDHHRSCIHRRFCSGRQCLDHACEAYGHDCGRVHNRETTRVLNTRVPLAWCASPRPPRSTPIYKIQGTLLPPQRCFPPTSPPGGAQCTLAGHRRHPLGNVEPEAAATRGGDAARRRRTRSMSFHTRHGSKTTPATDGPEACPHQWEASTMSAATRRRRCLFAQRRAADDIKCGPSNFLINTFKASVFCTIP